MNFFRGVLFSVPASLLLWLLIGATAAHAQISGVTQDLTSINAAIATIPTPAATVPPIEAVGGAVGSAGTYRPASAVQPRITRAGQCTVAGGVGACSGTWSTAFPAGAGINVIFTPVNTTAVQPITCNLTATPTLTGYAAKCWTSQNATLSLAIITAGLSLSPSGVAPDGTVVQVTGLPQTQ